MSKTWNSKLIVTLAGITAITTMAVAGVITGAVAVPVVFSLVAGYAGLREATAAKRAAAQK